VVLHGNGVRAEESRWRQVGEGVEAGVEVDVEVHGTRAKLVAVSSELESGWRRPAPVMRP
jgi:hypothetical protein